MKKILYQKRSRKIPVVLFIVLTPLMALKGGSQTKSVNPELKDKVIIRRANEIMRNEVDKLNDTIRFIDSWQKFKDSVDRIKIQDTENANKK